MEVAVGSEQGLRQSSNGDGYLSAMPVPGMMFFGVADGFGTLEQETPTAVTALTLVCDALRTARRGGNAEHDLGEGEIRTMLLAALDHANARLYAFAGSHEDFVGVGSSLTVVLIVGRQAFIGHLGDARAYLLRFGRLERLTRDDAVFSEVRDPGDAPDVRVSPKPEAKTSLPAKPRGRGVLWRSLGTQSKLEAGIAHITLLAGDQILLCTDGVHRSVSSDEMCGVLLDARTAEDGVSRLLAMTKTRGALDNATLVLARDLLVLPDAPSKTVRRNAPLSMVLGCALFLVLVFLTLFRLH